MVLITIPPAGAPLSPFSEACARLRAAGHTVEPSDIPGLTIVSGIGELTIRQVIGFAAGLPQA